jgi:hypothetical protein
MDGFAASFRFRSAVAGFATTLRLRSAVAGFVAIAYFLDVAILSAIPLSQVTSAINKSTNT